MKTVCFINLPFIKKKKLTIEERSFSKAYQDRYKKVSNNYLRGVPTYNVPEPPLWIPLLGAVLRDKYNLEVVDLFDFNENDFTDEKLYHKLKASKADFFFLSSTTIQYVMARKVAKFIKKTFLNSKILIGGCHATFTDEECLKDGFNVVVRGEGEITTPELLKSLSLNQSINHIKGISFIKDNKLVRTSDRQLIKNLDNLPTPEYNLIPNSFKKIKTIVRVYCSRGCPYNCAFCADTVWKGRTPVYKSLKRILEEMQLLSSIMKTKLFYIGDETFTANEKFVKSFCDEIKKTGYTWLCQTRVNHINKPLVETMANSNCKEISFGAENATQKILDINRKGTNVTQIAKACKIVKDTGINVLTYWLCGLPGETKQTYNKTINYIKNLFNKNLTDLAEYFICVPYPGTPIFNNPEQFKVKIQKEKDGSYNWDKFREDSPSVMSTQHLTNKEIYDLWKKGLYEFAKAMEK